jgi:hypothetical protein
MPAPNELTPEEEAEFSQHGVAPAGQGSEPVIEGNEAQPQEPVIEEPIAQAPEAAPVAAPEVSRHREDGTFKTKEEFDADMAAAMAASGTQPAPVTPPPAQAQPQMVPHQALHEARQREAAARAQAQLATTRLNAILASQSGRGQQQPEAMPDLNADPVGYIQALESRLAAFEEQRQQETQFREIDQAIDNDERLFSESVPDYQVASDYYVQSRAKELLQFYPVEQAQEIMMRETRQIADQSWKRGLSVGQTVYQLAQARGYQPGNTAADPTRAPIPARPAPAAAPALVPVAPTAQQRVDQINNGQSQSRSLGGAGGGASTKALNAEALLAMGDEEFAEHLRLDQKGANERFQQVG